MIYEPAEDTFLLAKHIKKYAKGNVLDIGAGSGYLSRISLENKANVFASDFSSHAVQHLRKQKINAVKSDLFSNIKRKFDLIIFNPPYLPEDKDEPKYSRLSTTGGKKGNEIIISFLMQAKKYLKKDGKILLLFSSLTPGVLEFALRLRYKYKKLDEQKLFFEKIYVYLFY